MADMVPGQNALVILDAQRGCAMVAAQDSLALSDSEDGPHSGKPLNEVLVDVQTPSVQAAEATDVVRSMVG